MKNKGDVPPPPPNDDRTDEERAADEKKAEQIYAQMDEVRTHSLPSKDVLPQGHLIFAYIGIIRS